MSQLLNYGLLMASTVMFGFMFFFSDIFRKYYGSGFKASLVMNLGGSIIGLFALIVINGFRWEFSYFALIMAVISALNGLLFSFCSLKALGKINLSLYSLFSMLGGMALPFVSGILFHGEALTIGRLICFVIITVALCLTVKKGEGKSAVMYYAGVFVFNGTSGVVSKVYQALPYTKISSAGYSVLIALVSILLSAVFLIFIKGEKKRINLPCVIAMAGHGILGKVANWLLLIALASLPASAQYPFVTGGTMIVSTVISLVGINKPNKKEILAVLLAFVGVVVLVLLPEIEIFKIIWR